MKEDEEGCNVSLRGLCPLRTQATASEATLMCLLSARTLFFKKEREKTPDITIGQLLDKLVAYCSDQVSGESHNVCLLIAFI